ncbi:MAG: ThuA domain-containing protein, partial [Phycisphaerales bacterium]
MPRVSMTIAALVLCPLIGSVGGATAGEPGNIDPAVPGPIRTLLVTGLNNHNWPFTSRVFAETLEATGRFSVEITDQPELSFASEDALRRVQLFVFDYNDLDQPQSWDRMAKKNFVQAVKAGAGVVAIHAANNAFKGPPAWSEYEFMVGYMWRDGAGHGKFHEFDVETVDPDHPVTRGLPPIKAHPDELYHKLSNPQLTKPHLLMQAMSSK